jgi:predicted metalloprotease with PDZ domain
MNPNCSLLLRCLALLAAALPALGQNTAGTMAFTVSMEQPSNHLFHVVFRCDGLKGDTLDFKMPVWTPGFYSLLNYANNVEHFRAENAAGTSLEWTKSATNTWHVQCREAGSVVVSYDVRSERSFVANCFLDENRGYIMPAGLLMHVAGQIQRPVTLTIMTNPAWSTVATSLEPASPGTPYTFAAPNFDILYDSPILMGNLEKLPSFEIHGIPHDFFGYKLAEFDRGQFMNDLKRVLEAGIAVIGDIPYKHYTFLAFGPSRGGIEHLDSTSFGFSGERLTNSTGRIRDLSFLAHEYFHHYNVKRIRPIALGPFNYDTTNLTSMLWVSEGFTVYYEYLMVARAGLMPETELLNGFTRDIAAYEGNPGHLLQSATESSLQTWSQGSFGGGRGGSGLRKTISYYNKGAVLGLLLDFKIRHESRNAKSLDTVMRALYREYYQEKQRGWTDSEFQAACEQVAGTGLSEYFDYAATTKEVDYDKYLGYAGLQLEPPRELTNAWLGVVCEEKEGKLFVAALERNSPAQRAGLKPQDEIKRLDGVAVAMNAKGLTDALAARKPGDKVTLSVLRSNKEHKLEATLGHKLERTFHIKRIPNPDPLQTEILRTWVKG